MTSSRPDWITVCRSHLLADCDSCLRQVPPAAPVVDASRVPTPQDDPRCTCLIGVEVPGIMGPMTFTTHDSNCPARFPAASPTPEAAPACVCLAIDGIHAEHCPVLAEAGSPAEDDAKLIERVREWARLTLLKHKPYTDDPWDECPRKAANEVLALLGVGK